MWCNIKGDVVFGILVILYGIMSGVRTEHAVFCMFCIAEAQNFEAANDDFSWWHLVMQFVFFDCLSRLDCLCRCL